MPAMGYSQSTFTPLDPGIYKAKISNTYMFESEYNGKKNQQVLIEFDVFGPKEGEAWEEQRALKHFIGATYNPKSKRAKATPFFFSIFGRELSEDEFKEFDTDYLIGLPMLITVGVKTDEQGAVTKNLIQAFTLKEHLTIAQLMEKWEAGGKPTGKQPEWLSGASGADGDEW